MAEELKSIRSVLDEELLRQRGIVISSQLMNGSFSWKKKETFFAAKSSNSMSSSLLSPKTIRSLNNSWNSPKPKQITTKIWFMVYKKK